MYKFVNRVPEGEQKRCYQGRAAILLVEESVPIAEMVFTARMGMRSIVSINSFQKTRSKEKIQK